MSDWLPVQKLLAGASQHATHRQSHNMVWHPHPHAAPARARRSKSCLRHSVTWFTERFRGSPHTPTTQGIGSLHSRICPLTSAQVLSLQVQRHADTWKGVRQWLSPIPAPWRPSAVWPSSRSPAPSQSGSREAVPLKWYGIFLPRTILPLPGANPSGRYRDTKSRAQD